MTIRRELQKHETSNSSLSGVEFEVARFGAQSLRLRWVVRGATRNLRLPKIHGMGRAGTEPTSLFTLFACAAGQDSHVRLDVSPDGKWEMSLHATRDAEAAKFDAGQLSHFDVMERRKPLSDEKRSRLKEAGFDTLERFEPSFLSVSATLELKPNYVLPLAMDWLLGVAATIEEKNGNRSVWALAHPPGVPDTTHADNFAIRIPTTKI